MRVVHLYRYCFEDRVGGVERYVRDLAVETCARGAEVKALVSHPTVWHVAGSRQRTPWGELVRLPRLPEVLSGTWSPTLPAWLRGLPLDVQHLHWPSLAALQADGRPAVLTYHNDVVRQQGLMGPLQGRLEALLARSLLIVSARENVDSSRVLARHRDRCRVIPHGIDLAAYELTPELERARDALRERHRPPFGLFVGRLVPFKGAADLLEAWADLPGTLLVVGDGPERASLERRAAQGDLAGRVVFAGVLRDELPAWYHAADVFCLPSRSRIESFGLVQVEAQACGVPVVSTRLGTGVEAVNVHGDTGLTVPPGDVQALREALRTLLEEPALRAELGESARERARRRYGRDRMAEETLEVYREAAQGS